MSDAELLAGCLEGSLTHQRNLYHCFAPQMMGVCMRYASSEAEAEDMLQEGFIQVFRKIDTFSGTGELGAWVRRIMVNAALMHYRKHKKHLMNLELAEVGYSLESDENLWQQMGARDLMLMVQQLPAGCRMVFNLYAVEGYNHREIAEKLGMTTGTSKSQYSRARSLLRQMIENESNKVHGTTY